MLSNKHGNVINMLISYLSYQRWEDSDFFVGQLALIILSWLEITIKWVTVN